MTARLWQGLGLAALTALTLLVPQAIAQTPATPVAATANGEAIPRADIDAIIKARAPSAVPPSELQRRQQQFAALDMLIDDLLMQQFLRKNGPQVDPSEVTKRLVELEEG